MPYTENELNSIMEEEQEVEHRLANEFPEYQYKRAMHEYLGFMERSLSSLDTLFSSLVADFDPSKLRPAFPEACFYLFNFMSTIQACFKLMENNAKRNINPEFGELAVRWKRVPLFEVVFAFRHAYQHGDLVEHDLSYRVFTSKAPVEIALDFTPETWSLALGENRSDKVINFLKEFKAKNPAPLLPLLREFLTEFHKFVADANALFDSLYPNQTPERQRLLDRKAAISKWYEENGIGVFADP